MTDILTDLSAPALIVAIKANPYAFFRYLGRSSSAEFAEGPSWCRWHTQIPHPWFNGVLSTQPADQNAAQLIQDTLAYFRARKVSSLTWWLEPQLELGAWDQSLRSRGFRYDNHTPGMAVELAGLSASGSASSQLEIRPIEDLAGLQTWTSTFMAGYGIPDAWAADLFDLFASLGLVLPIRHYVGYWHGQPVVTSTLFLAAGVAGIYNVATLPNARGQGFGAALTTTPLHEARDLGYRAGVLQSSEQGYHVYQRLGFQHLCQMEHFYWGAG
jgi:GNAT superfamily N-acetyltransferase